MSETLVGIADRCWSRRGGRSAGAADLAVYLADVRQRERAGLVRLERFVRGTVLSCTHPGTTARRRVLEALGEAGGLCTARMVEVSSGDVIFCTREAGHCAPDDLPGFKRGTSDGAPGGWHLAGGSIWSDAGAACTPHTPCPVAGGDVRVVSWVRRSAGDLEQRGRGPGCGAASGRGLSAVRVAGAVAEAAVRERETAEELRSPGPVERGLVALDPEELAERWAARHGEWWRVQALMAASGWGGYGLEWDGVGLAWAAERTVRRERFIAAYAAYRERCGEAVDEVRGEVWLAAGQGRLLRQAAARAGLTPQEVLARLVSWVVVGEDGAVSVESFIPAR